MYSRYISSLTRFSSILLDFLVIFLSSPFLAAVFISRVSLVLFVPFMRPFRVPLFSSAPPFPCSSSFIHRFFSSRSFFPLLFLRTPVPPSGLFALHSPLPHSYAGHILSPRMLLFRAPLASLLFHPPFLHHGYFAGNTRGKHDRATFTKVE